MAQLVFWDAPTSIVGVADEDVDEVRIYGNVSGTPAIPADLIATISARDAYDNWITGYLHSAGTTAWGYQEAFYKDGSIVGAATAIHSGVTPLQITPFDVWRRIQGLPLNEITYEQINDEIVRAISWVENEIRQKLSSTTVTKEIYPSSYVNRILRFSPQRFRLRHYPVISVDNIYVRQAYKQTAGVPTDTELDNYYAAILNKNEDTGYNRGAIQIWIQQTVLPVIFQNIPHFDMVYREYPGYLLVSYTHGWATIPTDLIKCIELLAAIDLMEIAGEAENPGVSSQSIDGVSETYTASATTTQFSGRRDEYKKQVNRIIAHYQRLGYA